MAWAVHELQRRWSCYHCHRRCLNLPLAFREVRAANGQRRRRQRLRQQMVQRQPRPGLRRLQLLRLCAELQQLTTQKIPAARKTGWVASDLHCVHRRQARRAMRMRLMQRLQSDAPAPPPAPRRPAGPRSPWRCLRGPALKQRRRPEQLARLGCPRAMTAPSRAS